MFDKQKMKELEQRSHNRGLLSKEFYLTEQQQLERKRREMKAQLDRQVEERRRQKEQEKMENQRRIRKEEEEIKNYYKHLESRDKRTSANDSSALHASNMKLANQPYQTYPADTQSDSRQKGVSLSKGKGGQSRPNLHDGDIPLMPLLSLDPPLTKDQHQQHSSVLAISKQSVANIGSIPLLNLNDEANPALSKAKKAKQKTTKREKTLETIKQGQDKTQNSRQLPANPASIALRQERRSTLADEESIFGSVVHANTNAGEKPLIEHYEIPEEVVEMEQENKSLKMELRKKEQALSLLMGAVRSNGNGKLNKYLAQAERIQQGERESGVRRGEESEEEKTSMLPKIHMKNQSIMHDYLLAAARRGKKHI